MSTTDESAVINNDFLGTGSIQAPDEVMSIASAMLFAGFGGVVGTLWAIADADGPAMSEAFYTHLFRGKDVDTRDAAISLHLAVKKLRSDNTPLIRWVPFVHLGA
jgi:CHAT domain-containing protein